MEIGEKVTSQTTDLNMKPCSEKTKSLKNDLATISQEVYFFDEPDQAERFLAVVDDTHSRKHQTPFAFSPLTNPCNRFSTTSLIAIVRLHWGHKGITF